MRSLCANDEPSAKYAQSADYLRKYSLFLQKFAPANYTLGAHYGPDNKLIRSFVVCMSKINAEEKNLTMGANVSLRAFYFCCMGTTTKQRQFR